jgi:hypothetical protein
VVILEEVPLNIPYAFYDSLWGRQSRKHVGQDGLKHQFQEDKPRREVKGYEGLGAEVIGD